MLDGRVRAVGLFARSSALIASIAIFCSAAFAQTVCTPNANAVAVHAEGLTERVGDITLSCTGGNAGSTVSLTMFVTLNTNITNRVDNNGSLLGISLTGATGSVRATSATTLNVSPINYTVPTPASTPVLITLSGIRAAVASLPAYSTFVTASLLGVGASFPQNLSLVIANSVPTLQSSVLNNGVPCAGSPLPATLDFPGFLAATTFSTVRVTEATAKSFTVADAGADTGLRIRVNLTGYGAGSRVFVPDVIVGNSGTVPTSAGGFFTTQSGGTYTPGSNQLLLVRVNGAAADGSGGTLVRARPVLQTAFSDMTEVAITGGNATVVYEVLDSSTALVESAQIPVFVVASASACPSTLNPQLAAGIAPVSTVATSTATDAIPRFIATVPPSDCQQAGDCAASYFPKLSVDQTMVTLTGTSRGGPQTASVRVSNIGSGTLSFTTSIAYDTGSGWLSLSPTSGANNVTVRVTADPAALTEGAYKATITIDAGPYGKAMVPVVFNVGPLGAVILNVGNAASFQYGTVAPGSYAVLYGMNLTGTNVGVTFNGLPADVIFKNASQINLIVPAALSAPQTANVVVTVDGQISAAFGVNLVANSPGIFTPGIVNFDDGAVNDAAHPAKRGSFVLVFFTGLAVPVAPGTVTVNMGSQMNLLPSFAGPQGLPALDQVNITVPTSLPAGTNPVSLQICAPGSAAGQPVCSNQVNLYIQ